MRRSFGKEYRKEHNVKRCHGDDEAEGCQTQEPRSPVYNAFVEGGTLRVRE